MKHLIRLINKIHCFDYKQLVLRVFGSKKIRLTFFLIILIFVPTILAIPIPPYSAIYKIKLTNNIQSESKGVQISPNMQAAGTSFFSKISGISLYKYKTTLCVYNKNEPVIDFKPVNRKDLSDASEVGAMEITIEYSNGTTTLYAPPQKTTCQQLREDFSTSSQPFLLNNPIFRNPMPFGQPIYESSPNGTQIKIPLHNMVGTDPSKTKIFILPVIVSLKTLVSKEFFLNYIISFIAWSIVYIHLLHLWETIKTKSKEAFKK